MRGRLRAGNLDADLTEDTELIHLEPEFGDFAIFEAVEDDGVLVDWFA